MLLFQIAPATLAGPGDFERALAARRVVWAVRALRGRATGAAVDAALPALLAFTDDSASAIQCAGAKVVHDFTFRDIYHLDIYNLIRL